MNNIKTIFFDLYGVLIGFNSSQLVYFLTQKTNLNIDQAIQTIYETKASKRFMIGKINFNQYYEELINECPETKKINFSDFRKKWFSNTIDILPTVKSLNILHKKYSLWIISNTSEKNIKYLKKNYDFLNHFDGIITSEVAEVSKPNPKIFLYALKQANSSIENSLFIDDRKINIEAASSLGFYTFQFADFKKYNHFISPLIKN